MEILTGLQGKSQFASYMVTLSCSLFVLLKGASKDEAFRIGKEIVEAVTADNPKPVKLKFEKVFKVLTTTLVAKITLQVYLPCVLQTKKRYVGYAYESVDQKEPIFDAKGIETVRRDGCPAVVKVDDHCTPTPATCIF